MHGQRVQVLAAQAGDLCGQARRCSRRQFAEQYVEHASRVPRTGRGTRGGRSQQQHAFATCLPAGGGPGSQFAQRRAPDGLKRLGQLAGEYAVPLRTQNGCQVFKCFQQAVWCLEQHHDSRIFPQRRDGITPGPCLGRQKTGKAESFPLQSAGRQGRDDCRRTRNGTHPVTSRQHGLDQPCARVRYGRRARIRHLGDTTSGCQPFDNLLGHLALVVLAQTDLARLNAEGVQQLSGYARIFGCDDIHRCQNVTGTGRQIGQVPNRSGHHI